MYLIYSYENKNVPIEYVNIYIFIIYNRLLVKRFEYGNHLKVAVTLYGEQNIFITAKYLCQLLILLFDVVNGK